MRDIYVLIHGQNRLPKIFVDNINLFNKLLKDGVIKKVIVSTWIGEHSIEFKKHCNFTYLELPKLIENGHGNWIAQMTNYEHAYKYIRSIAKNPDDTYILKSRPDAFMSEKFLKHVIQKDLTCTGNIFKRKIWIPWAELIKPMYFGDELFFGHLDDMGKMYNYNKVYKQETLGQGVTHIRRFIEPFVKEYPILKDYIENKNNLNVHILVINDLNKIKSLDVKSYKYFILLISTYYQILNTYFDIETDVTGIIFRQWSNYNQSERVNSEESLLDNNKRLCTICRKMVCFGNEVLIGNKKCMYNNDFVNNVIKGKFNEIDDISKAIFNEFN
jgi:hypothetical protein